MEKRGARRKIAFTLRNEGKSLREIATKLGVSIATVHKDIKVAQTESLKSRAKKETSLKGGPLTLESDPKGEFATCFTLILGEAKRCLADLKLDLNLSPSDRVKQIQILMDSISKATKVAKKLDPNLNLELVIRDVLTIVGEVLLKNAPTLGEEFIKQTHEIEYKIVLRKEQWAD